MSPSHIGTQPNLSCPLFLPSRGFHRGGLASAEHAVDQAQHCDDEADIHPTGFRVSMGVLVEQGCGRAGYAILQCLRHHHAPRMPQRHFRSLTMLQKTLQPEGHVLPRICSHRQVRGHGLAMVGVHACRAADTCAVHETQSLHHHNQHPSTSINSQRRGSRTYHTTPHKHQ